MFNESGAEKTSTPIEQDKTEAIQNPQDLLANEKERLAGLKRMAREFRDKIENISNLIDSLKEQSKDDGKDRHLEIRVEELRLKETEDRFDKILNELPDGSQF